MGGKKYKKIICQPEDKQTNGIVWLLANGLVARELEAVFEKGVIQHDLNKGHLSSAVFE